MNNIKEIIFTYIDDNQIEHTIKLDNFINPKDVEVNMYSNKSQEYKYINGHYTLIDEFDINSKINISLSCEGFDIQEVKNDN